MTNNLCCVLSTWARCSECEWAICTKCIPSNVSAFQQHNTSSPSCGIAALKSMYDVTSYRDKSGTHVLVKGKHNEAVRRRPKST